MPAAPPRCLRCSKTDSSPHRFILTCFSCARSWHHRCHVPPVTDQELISRLKASLHNYANSLSGWRCRRCTNNPRLTVGTASKPIEVPDSPPPSSTRSLPVDMCLLGSSYHPEVSSSTLPRIRQETPPRPATNREIPRNERETPPVDLTSLSDHSLGGTPHFSDLSIDDISQTNDSTMDEVITAADESRPGQAPSKIEWHTSRVHQSIPEIAPLNWMRLALCKRKERIPTRPDRKLTPQQGPGSGKMLFVLDKSLTAIPNPAMEF